MSRHQFDSCAPDCFGCKIQTISVSPSAMPTRSDAANINKETAKSHADVAAYRRLRHDGTQPKSVRGAAALEKRADSKWEIETGTNLGGNVQLARRMDETQSAISKGETL